MKLVFMTKRLSAKIMKLITILLFLAHSLHLTIPFPVDESSATKLLSNEIVEVYGIKIDDSEESIFIEVIYNDQFEQLEFTTCNKISTIRIFDNDGHLEFQLPVESNRVLLSKSIFGEGEYVLGFLMSGEDEIHLTQVHFF